MPNILNNEQAELHELLMEVWERNQSADDAYDEISGYVVGMRNAQAERDQLRADNERLRHDVERYVRASAEDELDQLRADRDSWQRVAEQYAQQRDEVMVRWHGSRSENQRLRQALSHYAADYDYDRGVSVWDGGAKAREALYADEATAIAQETGQYDDGETDQ